MATSLKAFQQEISTISESKKAQHLRELKQAQQAALEHGHGHGHGNKGVKSGAGGGGGKGKENGVGGSGGGKEKEKEKGKEGEGRKVEGVEGEGQGLMVEPEGSIEEILSQPYTPPPDESNSESQSEDPLLHHLAHRLLGTHHRELIVHLGAHPSASVLFGTGAGHGSGSGEKEKEKEKEKVATGGDEAKKEKDVKAAIPTSTSIGKSITQDQLSLSLTRLKSACKTLHAELTQLYLHTPTPTSSTASTNASVNGNNNDNEIYGRWLVRLIPNKAEEIIEVRVAVVGNVDSGKSTLTGVLTRGGLDDGRGKTRVALFRHKHEMETGRTSSVGLEILGFSPTGTPVVPTGHAAGAGDTTTGSTVAKREKIAWDEVCSKAAKVVSFIDLAGHERYLKTTLFGLTGCSPDYVMLIVGGNAGLIGMSKEHLGVSLALQVPIIICVTKIDMTPAHVLEQTIKQLVKVLKSPGCRKTPVFVESMQQAIDCATHLGTERICPIFLLSNVTGSGLDNLRGLLNCLPSSEGGKKYVTDAPLEFSISDVFSVPFAGSVASGLITSGTVKTGDNVLLGPDSVGQFIPTTIKSIQRKRVDVDTAEAGQSVSFALKKIRRAQLRKGMVILARQDPPPKAVRRFEAQMLVLNHSTTIANRFQAMCHINSVRQTVRIVSIDHPSGVLRTGDRAKVIFEFIQQPEFISSGSTLFVREARCRLLGVVTGVIKKEGEEAKGTKHGAVHGHGHGHGHGNAHAHVHAHPPTQAQAA